MDETELVRTPLTNGNAREDMSEGDQDATSDDEGVRLARYIRDRRTERGRRKRRTAYVI